MNIKKIFATILLVFISVFFLYWLCSLVRCEILTVKYGEEFIGLEMQTNMIGPATSLKVLEYSEEYARVYYKDEGGFVFEFYKNNDVWIRNRWYAVWSKTGSADDIMWPYIR